VTLVLDAGAITALPGCRAQLHELLDRGLWPAQVSVVVLVETLTGDHRRDFDANRLLRSCQIRIVDETIVREAARLRTATGRAGSISAVDAIVAAHAQTYPDVIVLTGEADDLTVLTQHTTSPVTVHAV
jgi:predicted nucleic acid-binding protein